jgi:membrane-associated protein
MDALQAVFDIFLHLDRHLEDAVSEYGVLTYLLLTLIVFLETGVVFAPFLPGDSLIFAAAALAARGLLDPFLLFVLLAAAAIGGDTVNYWIGKLFGTWLVRSRWRLVRPEHLARTHAFFERYGGMTIVIARFVPIVRTVAPFVAGMGAMTYRKFLYYNVVGGIIWVGLCTSAGYWFGTWQPVRENFALVIVAIVILSVIPAVYGYVSARLAAARPPR